MKLSTVCYGCWVTYCQTFPTKSCTPAAEAPAGCASTSAGVGFSCQMNPHDHRRSFYQMTQSIISSAHHQARSIETKAGQAMPKTGRLKSIQIMVVGHCIASPDKTFKISGMIAHRSIGWCGAPLNTPCACSTAARNRPSRWLVTPWKRAIVIALSCPLPLVCLGLQQPCNATHKR
eukprot:COSAG02_NODE_1641_length_11530_cov_4.345289_3_plen_176_part_00